MLSHSLARHHIKPHCKIICLQAQFTNIVRVIIHQFNDYRDPSRMHGFRTCAYTNKQADNACHDSLSLWIYVCITSKFIVIFRLLGQIINAGSARTEIASWMLADAASSMGTIFHINVLVVYIYIYICISIDMYKITRKYWPI